MKRFIVFIALMMAVHSAAANTFTGTKEFAVKGFHLDLRIQVMTMPALHNFARQLKQKGFNTLIVEWEANFPFEKHPIIPGKYSYDKKDVIAFLKYCNQLGLDVIPLQQCFGHVEYILQHQRYKMLREDQKDYSQVCPLVVKEDSLLFSDLFSELAQVHTSPYMHIGGDETYLLGHDERCQAKAAKEGKSKLYMDYIKMICNIVLSLGKRPVVWADIALKYPEAIADLPRETVFVDWNYGWDLDRFGDHQRLIESRYEVWGAPSLRSSPDNYYLTDWGKHFNNIRDFVPLSENLGYKGIILTSWSTSGIYSSVFESHDNLMALYAIRHVYPLSGFNILIDEFSQRMQNPKSPFAEEDFVAEYGERTFGFTKRQSIQFWKALKTTPYDVRQGEVASPTPMTLGQLLDSVRHARAALYNLKPSKNESEFEHFKLMADIREFHLEYELIENKVNDHGYKPASDQAPIINELTALIKKSKSIDTRFIAMNKGFLNRVELDEENTLRNFRMHSLYERLSKHPYNN